MPQLLSLVNSETQDVKFGRAKPGAPALSLWLTNYSLKALFGDQLRSEVYEAFKARFHVGTMKDLSDQGIIKQFIKNVFVLAREVPNLLKKLGKTISSEESKTRKEISKVVEAIKDQTEVISPS